MKRGFNFVELLMVMLILGVIITLTMPLIKNIKDDEDIYRSYMKKANQDVTDAITMSFTKNRYMTGLNMLGNTVIINELGNDYACDAIGIRNVFNMAISARKCGVCTADELVKSCSDWDAHNMNKNFCITRDFPTTDDENPADYLTIADMTGGNNPGLILGNKSVMLFEARSGINCSVANDDDYIYGYVYVDMNGDKSPNKYCKDRYKFIIYNDRVAMDESCNLEL